MDWIQQRDGSANDTPWSGSSNWQTMDPRQWPYYFGANPWQWVQSQQHLWQEMQRWQWLHAQNSWKSYFEQMHGPSRGVDGQATQPRGQQESCEHDSIPYPQPTGWIQGHFNGRRQHQMQPQDRGASKPWQAPDRAGHSAGQSFVHREGSSDQSS